MIPQAWYPDPLDSTRLRYWDGRAWTQNILLPGPVPTDLPEPEPVSPPTPAAGSAAGETAPAADVASLPERPARPALSTQQVLLVLGGALVLTAVIAFVAFIWGTVGPYGQAGILAVVALAFGIAAVRITRLRATRETFSVIAWGIFAILVAVGPQFGYLPADLFTTASFATATVLALVTALTLLAARHWHFLVLWLVGWVLYAVTACVLMAAVRNRFDLDDPFAAGCVGLALIAAATLLVPRPPAFPTARALVAAVLAGLAGIGIVVIALDEPGRSPARTASVLVASAIAFAVGRLLPPGRLAHFAHAVAAGLIGVAIGMQANGDLPPAWEGAALAVLGCAALAVAYWRRSGAVAVLAVSLWLTWVVAVLQRATDVPDLGWAAVGFLAVLALAALAASLLTRFGEAVYVFAVAAGTAAVLYLGLVDVTLVEGYSACLLVVALVTVGVLRRVGLASAALSGELAVGALLLATVPSSVAAVVTFADPAAEPIHLAVGVAGVVGCYAWASLDRRVRWVAWPAALVAMLLAWLPVADVLPGGTTVEYVTLTAFAALVLAAWLALAPPAARWFTLVAALVLTTIHTVLMWAWVADGAASTRPQVDDLPLLPPLTIALAIVGVGLWEWLAVRGWTPGYWVAAGIALVSAWVDMAQADVSSAGRYGLVFAGAYLLASLPTLLRHPGLPSIVWLGPAVLAATVPYAIEYGIDAGRAPAWFVTVLAVAVVLAVVGGLRGIAGVFVPGAVNVAIIVVAQVVHVVGVIPAWVSLAVGGAVLLAVGVRLEWTRTAVRTGATWLRHLE